MLNDSEEEKPASYPQYRLSHSRERVRGQRVDSRSSQALGAPVMVLRHPSLCDVLSTHDAALQREAQMGYYVPSGKYWKEEARFDVDLIDELDRLWLRVVAP